MFADRREIWLAEGEAGNMPLPSWRVAGIPVVGVEPDGRSFQRWRVRCHSTSGHTSSAVLQPGESATLDFGEHVVGELSLAVESVGSAVLRPIVAETPSELADPIERYPGTLKAQWQPEALQVREGYQHINLPRRHALRYVRVEVLSSAGPVRVRSATMQAFSSAGQTLPPPHAHGDGQLQKLDEVSIRTLRNCMQDVFEDGPKRDRRLWLGDLRLQALAAYPTLGGHALVRRCLHLLAGCARSDGFVPACVFAKPTWHHGNEFIPDYALLLGATVLDYAIASDDWATARDLWPLVRRQADLPDMMMDDRGLVRDRGDQWIFIDWCEALNREAALQGVFIYGLRRTLTLGRKLDVPAETLKPIAATLDRLVASAAGLWDARLGCYLSGPERQASWASQVWMILADVADRERSKQALRSVMASRYAIRPQTPYLYHHVVEAMWRCGMVEDARCILRDYWGGMLDRGATTFWEVFDPGDDYRSPYGSHLLNSYCHAWSCTPSWFIRRGLFDRESLVQWNSQAPNTPEVRMYPATPPVPAIP